MSTRFSRLLLVLVLALTVPVQGFAAVTAGVCMALGHHDGAEPESHAHPHESAAGHEQGGADHQSPGDSHCPPCVSCCAAVALTSFSPLALPERTAAQAVPALPPLFSGVTPERLDRPPLAL